MVSTIVCLLPPDDDVALRELCERRGSYRVIRVPSAERLMEAIRPDTMVVFDPSLDVFPDDRLARALAGAARVVCHMSKGVRGLRALRRVTVHCMAPEFAFRDLPGLTLADLAMRDSIDTTAQICRSAGPPLADDQFAVLIAASSVAATQSSSPVALANACGLAKRTLEKRMHAWAWPGPATLLRWMKALHFHRARDRAEGSKVTLAKLGLPDRRPIHVAVTGLIGPGNSHVDFATLAAAVTLRLVSPALDDRR